MNEMRKLVESLEAIEEGINPRPDEIAEELTHIKDQIKDLLDNARDIMDQVGGQIEARATSYWLPHIAMALDSDHGYLGGSMATMQSTIDEILEQEDDEDYGKEDLGEDEGDLVSECFEVGDYVRPKIGPHAGQPHEIIHDHGDGYYNIKLAAGQPGESQYRLGGAKASKDQLDPMD